MIIGKTNQKASISANQRVELSKKAKGETFPVKYKTAAEIAKIFTTTIIIFISFLLKKWNRNACKTFGLL